MALSPRLSSRARRAALPGRSHRAPPRPGQAAQAGGQRCAALHPLQLSWDCSWRSKRSAPACAFKRGGAMVAPTTTPPPPARPAPTALGHDQVPPSLDVLGCNDRPMALYDSAALNSPQEASGSYPPPVGPAFCDLPRADPALTQPCYASHRAHNLWQLSALALRLFDCSDLPAMAFYRLCCEVQARGQPLLPAIAGRLGF